MITLCKDNPQYPIIQACDLKMVNMLRHTRTIQFKGSLHMHMDHEVFETRIQYCKSCCKELVMKIFSLRKKSIASTPYDFLAQRPTLKPCAERMCGYTEVKYKYGCRLYLVTIWCIVYSQIRLPYRPYPVEMPVSIILFIQAHARLISFCIQEAEASHQLRSVVQFDCTGLQKLTRSSRFLHPE